MRPIIDAFLVATAWAYLACAVYTVRGKSPLIGIDNRIQVAFYLCAFGVILYVHHNPGVWLLNALLGVFYAFGTVASFIGYPQRWAAYWKNDPEEGSAAGQMGMACWDLALAICFFMRLTL